MLKDMRDFTRAETYDIALSIFTSFGYFEDPRQDVAVLRNVFASLRPGGAFLIDMNGKEVIARKFLPSQWMISLMGRSADRTASDPGRLGANS